MFTLFVKGRVEQNYIDFRVVKLTMTIQMNKKPSGR